MDGPSSSSDLAPAKRQLPSRTRRATAGVVGSEVDKQILEAYKYKDSAQLLPPANPFLLSTNSAVAESSKEEGRLVNTVVNEQYFRRPEVIKAYREQSLIQTPGVVKLEAPESGTRLRVRDYDKDNVSSGDDAYIKRHKKYVAFEKRMRLREKEKLQYEHHKLKERIEQLRSMDSSAFLGLPAHYFSTPPNTAALNNLTKDGIHGNPAAIHEGERRRAEFIEAANALDERYRTLLPPERVTKKSARPPEDIPIPEPPAEEQTSSPAPTEPLKLKLPKAGSSSSASTRSPSYVQPTSAPPAAKKQKLNSGAKEPRESKEPSAPRQRKQSNFVPGFQPPLPAVHPSHTDVPIDPVIQEPKHEVSERISNLRTPLPEARILSLPQPTAPTPPPPRPTSPPPPVPDQEQLGNIHIQTQPGPRPMSYPEYTEGESISTARPVKRAKKTKASRNSMSRAPSLPRIEAIDSEGNHVAPSAAETQEPPVTQHEHEHGREPHRDSPAVSTSVPVSAPKSARTRPKAKQRDCILVQTARLKVSLREKPQRSVMAFGAKLPLTFKDDYEYALPGYVFEKKYPRTFMEPDGESADEEEEVDQLVESKQPSEAGDVVRMVGTEPPDLRVVHGNEGGEYEDMQEEVHTSRPPSPPAPSPSPSLTELKDVESGSEAHRMEQ
ncbi:hypothetical protein CC1G_06574 [Coprinopsis cinerea okayama7|uniref:Uncharacterized protein n=1 Tax=Coprinopsis cinerea (strain Okayama-7 / 130 / ATCC MYA-4618 / FGSC 9003) TaxID=240176 RepID=A8N302_COPC7|nr:hypothetical protein CC1G_06574 [Coprinopsis cinerea okayama7\|eukprot:XP_001829237.1 hypothetical protein CC1G_06574 [Coprinopsis cinerea okayama7\